MKERTCRSESARRWKAPTPAYLSNAAAYYLGRFAASEARLRKVLENKIRRAAMRNPDFAADDAAQKKLREAIDVIVESHKRTGAINDAAYAEMKKTGLRRAGGSARKITQKLISKGVSRALIEKSLKPEDNRTAEEEEMDAALEFVRRKKLGNFRDKKKTGDERKTAAKEFASMLRAGFSVSVAKKILPPIDEQCI